MLSTGGLDRGPLAGCDGVEGAGGPGGQDGGPPSCHREGEESPAGRPTGEGLGKGPGWFWALRNQLGHLGTKI